MSKEEIDKQIEHANLEDLSTSTEFETAQNSILSSITSMELNSEEFDQSGIQSFEEIETEEELIAIFDGLKKELELLSAAEKKGN